ncbi:glutathione S-transferase family protein [Phanerochaete sordida]|uniref:Glutathione S-transferase family protein n=1 Tax=Phanerochaete sordida TaxID=48140 RepID=A0A9P3GCL7_9APHY|nr:glutathione S-transferase family protein [Phanerochaete sordida]
MPVPDEKIFPHATGVAAKTVEEHQAPQDLVFYAGWFCPFVQRTWITLEERGIPYQYKEVNPYKKEKHFLDINPKGLVPAFEYKGKALYESLILCEFLEDAYPDAKPRLLPADPFERAYARIWLDFVAKSIVPANFRLLQAQTRDAQEDARAALTAAFAQFAEQIQGPYFLGEAFSLVDVAVAPWVVCDYIAVEHRGFRREGAGAKWVEYAERLEKRESVVRTCSDKEHYAEIYGRYLRDEAQSEVAKATRASRVIP